MSFSFPSPSFRRCFEPESSGVALTSPDVSIFFLHLADDFFIINYYKKEGCQRKGIDRIRGKKGDEIKKNPKEYTVQFMLVLL